MTITDRLEYLRQEIRAERIGYGEIVELQSLAPHIHPSDTELLEWAGVPEKMTPIAGLSTRYTTSLTVLNSESVQPDGSLKWFDTLAVIDGEEVDSVTVESSEDELPYRQALADAGWVITGVNWLTGNWRVRRKK